MNKKIITLFITIFILCSAYLVFNHSNLLAQDNKVPVVNEKSALSDNYKTAQGINIDIKLSKPFKQGDSIIAYINSESELSNPHISFAGNTYKLYKISNNEYRGIAGVDALAKPGGYTLKLADDTGVLNYSQVIEVANGNFPVQNIRISGSKASLEPTQDELDKVDAAKKNISDTSYWGTRPFAIPVKGPVVSVYGLNRKHNGVSTGDYHKGQDIKAPQGAPVLATEGGKILIAENFKLHGGTVAIDHGQGLMSIYIHLSKFYVKKGDIVKKGQPIAAVGSTGFATGPHLHWGLYVYGIPVNPKDWVNN